MNYPPDRSLKVLVNTLAPKGSKVVSYTTVNHPEHVDVEAIVRRDGVDTRVTCQIIWVTIMGGGWTYRNVVRHG